MSARSLLALPLMDGAAALILFAAIFVAAGGVESEAGNALCALAGGGLLGVAIAGHVGGWRRLPAIAAVPMLLLVALLALVLLQLTPWADAPWRGVPGRQPAEQLARLAGLPSWPVLSLDPQATRRFAAALLLPAGLFLATIGAGSSGRRLIVGAIVAGAAASAALGIAQVALGMPDWLSFYPDPIPVALGSFVNPNHHALLLLQAMLLAGGWIGIQRDARIAWPACLALVIGFALVVIATQSRAGIVLLLLAMPVTIALMISHRRRLLRALSMVGMIAGAAGILLMLPTREGIAFDTVWQGQEMRELALPDALYTFAQFAPWGSGYGSFVPVFAQGENLDLLTPFYWNHAHSEPLEWAIEAGLGGIALLAVALSLLLASGWRLGRARSSSPLAWAAFSALVLAMLHSLVDYPLRTAPLAATAAAALALALSPASPQRAPQGRPRLILGGLLGCAALIIGAQGGRLIFAHHLASTGRAEQALALYPEEATGWSRLAERRWADGDVRGAQAAAQRALALAPLDRAAARNLALALGAQGRDDQPAWQAASALGWRDGATQLWAFRAALAAGQWPIAAQRADALVRTRKAAPALLAEWRRLAGEPAFAAAMAERLSQGPGPIATWLTPLRPDDVAELDGALALADALARRHVLGRRDARAVLAAAVERGREHEAAALHAAIIGATTDALSDDPALSRSIDFYRDEATPFDWSVVDRDDVAVDRGEAGLRIDAEADSSGAVLRRRLSLSPGNYVLALNARSDRPDAASLVATCGPGRDLASLPVTPRDARTSATITAGPDCPVLTLTLMLRPQDRPGSIQFKSISVRRIGNGSRR